MEAITRPDREIIQDQHLFGCLGWNVPAAV